MRRGPLPASYCRSRAVPKSIGGSRRRLPARLGEWERFSARLQKIASIVADNQQARITVEDPAHGGQPATFEFSPDGVSRAATVFSLDSMGPRFNAGDLSQITEQKLAA